MQIVVKCCHFHNSVVDCCVVCKLQGYKSGYIYRNPELFHGEKPAEREVTTPSTVSSTRAKLYYTPEIERAPVRRAHSTGRANTYRNRVKWLNTPVKSTEYKKDKEKVELESDEPVTIKDLIPERVDKDLEQVKAFLVCCLEIIGTYPLHHSNCILIG